MSSLIVPSRSRKIAFPIIALFSSAPFRPYSRELSSWFTNLTNRVRARASVSDLSDAEERRDIVLHVIDADARRCQAFAEAAPRAFRIRKHETVIGIELLRQLK